MNMSEPLMPEDVAQLRTPPQSIESESSVLGGLLLDNRAFDRVFDVVVSDDFYTPENRLAFDAIASMINANKAADVLTVADELMRQGQTLDVGWMVYLNSLAQYVPSASNIRRYAEIVREKSMLRKMVLVSDEIATSAFSPQGKSVSELLDAAQQKVFTLGEQGAPRDDWQDGSAAAVELFDAIQRRQDGDEDFVPTGLVDLDDKLNGGMRPGQVMVIAGRPSMGKTALALSIGENVADTGRTVGVLSMEMPKAEVQSRRASMRSHVPFHKILRPERMNEIEWSQFTAATESIRKAPVSVSDQQSLTIHQVRGKARALKRQKGRLDLLIVDYIGLMEGTDRKANRATQLGEVSRGIKALAKELGIPVLLLAQLNREVEKRPNARPILSDLKESGDIEQDADVVVFVHRPIHVRPDLGPEWKYYAELIVGKNRSGACGQLDAQYVAETMHFIDWQGDRPTSQARTRGGEL